MAAVRPQVHGRAPRRRNDDRHSVPWWEWLCVALCALGVAGFRVSAPRALASIGLVLLGVGGWFLGAPSRVLRPRAVRRLVEPYVDTEQRDPVVMTRGCRLPDGTLIDLWAFQSRGDERADLYYLRGDAWVGWGAPSCWRWDASRRSRRSRTHSSGARGLLGDGVRKARHLPPQSCDSPTSLAAMGDVAQRGVSVVVL